MSHAELSEIDALIDGPSESAANVVEITSFSGSNEAEVPGVSLDLSDVHAGVSVYWLGAVFGMSTATIKKKLAECPPLRRRRNGHIYDLRDAAAYLVKPKIDIERFIKEMKADDLPPKLNKDYWEAKLKYQKWAVDAGELWRTSDVLEVLGEVFQHIRSTTQLWSVTIERAKGLTDEQRKLIEEMTDQLLDELHKKLVRLPAARRTPSLREIEESQGADDEEDLIGA